MAKAGKKKPPSRIRYEQGHPTVSCRVPKEVYDRLQAVNKSESRSFADILKIGLGILEVKRKEEEKIKKKAHVEGHRRGYADAQRLYIVTYPCKVCRGTLVVTSDDEKQAIKRYMQEHGWGHRQCYEKKR